MARSTEIEVRVIAPEGVGARIIAAVERAIAEANVDLHSVSDPLPSRKDDRVRYYLRGTERLAQTGGKR